MKRRYLAIVSAIFAAALVLSCAGAPQAAAPKSDEPFQLALFHVNDTHAKLDPLLVEF